MYDTSACDGKHRDSYITALPKKCKEVGEGDCAISSCRLR